MAELCEHMEEVTFPNGQTVTVDRLAECEEALRSVEEALWSVQAENERLRANSGKQEGSDDV